MNVFSNNPGPIPLSQLDDNFADLSSASGVNYYPVGTGAVATTVQAKLRESVSVKDFGAIGDGVTDDTAALTTFFNSANAHPGIPHRLFNGVYPINLQLPTITASNVIVECPGASIHDVGSIFNGAVIKWVGTAGATMQNIAPVAGASNQRLANLRLKGIAYDCNSLAAYGLILKSVWESELEFAAANATSFGAFFDVVATLGEARDVQRNRIRFIGRQIEYANGVALGITGDESANFSMNELWVDIQHKNLQAIYVINSDNNDWHFVRTYKVSGGTATESISLLGGATSAHRVRSERFHFLTCTLPLRGYGTGSYTYPSINNKIYCLDVENGSPAPIVDAGSTILWQKDSTPLADTAWTAYTPTVTSVAGTLTAAAATGAYLQRGKVVYVRAQITITNNGTGASAIGFTAPFATSGAIGSTFAGKERASTGKGVLGFIDGGGQTTVYLQFYDGTYPGANGYVINVDGFYEVA